MASFWDFLGGAADYTLKEQSLQRADQRELTKAKALEALRRETGDYEYNRARGDAQKKVDTQQSYLDPTTKEYVMVNSEGQVVGRRSATSSELSAAEAGTLKLEDMRTDIAYKKALTAQVGKPTGGGGGYGGGGRGSLDESRTPDGKLGALASSVVSNLRKYDLPPNFVAKAEAQIRAKIASGTATEAWIRNFEAAYLSDSRVNKTLESQSKTAAAAAIFGKPGAPEGY